jgi:WD40 repeat protein
MAEPQPEDLNPPSPPPDPKDEPTLQEIRKPPAPPPTEIFAPGRPALPNDLDFALHPVPAAVPVKQLGDYELIAEIARGGMGVIFQARHVRLHRVVALKMILGGQLARPDDLQRFHTEAEAAAQLQHPGIVALYEVGAHDGQPYFSMEYVQGTSLAQRAAAGPVPSRPAARYLELTARAVHYAHTRGILHRDLKPANVLVDEQDHPKVTDFGLAKLFLTDSGQTRTGAVIGTPSYMAPEQAAARKDLGPECDVYSLGAILYELLTGRPPFRGETALATLSLVAEQDPVPPRLLNPKVDIDLETICLKCLEKEPARRYRSAQALAEDLRRYQDGEPITARRLGAFGRGVKWCRRKPAAAALLAVSLLAGLGLFVILLLFGITEHDLRAQAEREHARAVEARNQARERADKMRRLLYLAQFHLAHHAWDSADLEQAERLLERWLPEVGRTDLPDLRGWEWYYLDGLCRGRFTLRGHRQRVKAVAYAPSGGQLASAGFDLDIRLWDPATGRRVRRIEQAHVRPVTALAYHPGGRLLASASDDRTVKLWDVKTGALVRVLKQHTAFVTSVAFSPDGKRLASAGGDQTVIVWDPDTGSPLYRLQGHQGPVNCVAFSPAGDLLASGGRDHSVRLWDPIHGKPVRTLTGHLGEVMALAFRDGRVLTSGGGRGTGRGEVRTWDVHTGKELLPRYSHADHVLCLAYGRDGRLAVGGRGGLVRVWDTATGSESFSFRGDTLIINALAFSPDGGRLATAGRAGMVRQWNTAGDQGEVLLEWPREAGTRGRVQCVAYSPDGRRLAAAGGLAGKVGTVHVWDARTFQVVAVLTGHTDQVQAIAFSPDGRRLASASWDRTVRVYDLATRKQVALGQHPGQVHAIAYSPDGRTVASAGLDHRIFLWDADTGKGRGVLVGLGNYISALAFSPDGRWLASGGFDQSVQVWDVAAGKAVHTLGGRLKATNAVAFSPDGKFLISGGSDKAVHVWDLDSGKEQVRLEGSAAAVTTVAYSPDGLRIACAGNDWKVHLWDVATSQEILTLEGLHGPAKCLAWSRDRRRLACADGNPAVHVWEAEAVAD